MKEHKEKTAHNRISSIIFALLAFAITIGMVNFIGRRYYNMEKEVLHYFC